MCVPGPQGLGSPRLTSGASISNVPLIWCPSCAPGGGWAYDPKRGLCDAGGAANFLHAVVEHAPSSTIVPLVKVRALPRRSTVANRESPAGAADAAAWLQTP